MYGTGDAADKLYTLLEERGVKVGGCFVNDEFVRNRTFHGYKVLSFQDAKRIIGNMAVVLGFGSHRPDVISDILRVNRETEFYAPDPLLDEEGNLLDNACLEKHLRKGKATPFDSIDNILSGCRASILKFDIEGQEPKALRGAEKTIRTWKPKMVLSAYHRIDDLWALSKNIPEYRNDYRFFLRHSPVIPAWEVEYFI